jgi:peptidoglycan-associated lipoprotein
MKRHVMTLLPIMLGAVVAITGCISTQKPDGPATGLDSGVETTTGKGLPDIDQRSQIFVCGSGMRSVYFDYDSSALSEKARSILKHNADLIRQFPDVVIQIEGHCDERGTQEYNLALGERRALAVRQYLMDLGVSGDRMITISYGEEWPATQGSNEAAWAQNRRAQFNEAR